MAPRAHLISLTLAQRRPKPDLPWLANCPNALDLDVYPFHVGHDGYLLFLGPDERREGCAPGGRGRADGGLPLRIAGKCREPLERAYFDTYVKPHLGDGIEYVGEVGHADKVELLQRARATIFPIEWEEPFGLVMIESLACGTPVVATRRGSVPEVLDDGVTGIIVDDYTTMADALPAPMHSTRMFCVRPCVSASRRSAWCATTWRPTRRRSRRISAAPELLEEANSSPVTWTATFRVGTSRPPGEGPAVGVRGGRGPGGGPRSAPPAGWSRGKPRSSPAPHERVR